MGLIEKKIAFVVLTCDKYSDLWPMYIHFFEKNWQDCPYDRYFVTNHDNFPNLSIDFINLSELIQFY